MMTDYNDETPGQAPDTVLDSGLGVQDSGQANDTPAAPEAPSASAEGQESAFPVEPAPDPAFLKDPRDERPYFINDWAGHPNFNCLALRDDGYPCHYIQLGREAFEEHWQEEHAPVFAEPAVTYSSTLTDHLGRPLRLS